MRKLFFVCFVLPLSFHSAAQTYEMSKKKIKEEKKILKQLKKELPKSTDLAIDYYNIGLTYENLEMFDSSKVYYKKTIKLNPENDLAYSGLGSIELYLKNKAEAIKNYNKSIELNPSTYNYAQRFVLYYVCKDWKNALIDIDSVIIKKTTKEAGLYFTKGEILFELNKFNEAIKTFNTVVAMDPNYPEIYFHRGEAYSFNEEDWLALNDLNKYINSLKMPTAKGLYRRGLTYYSLKQYNKAIKDFTATLQLVPNDIDCLYFRAFAKSDLQDYKGALADYNKLIELEPEESDWYYFRAFEKFDLDDREGACSDWVKAAKMGDEDAIYEIEENCKE